jgi:hypothetical protein
VSPGPPPPPHRREKGAATGEIYVMAVDWDYHHWVGS